MKTIPMSELRAFLKKVPPDRASGPPPMFPLGGVGSGELPEVATAVAGLAPADCEANRLYAEQAVGVHGLRIEAYETEDHRLMVALTSKNPQLQGHAVWVAFEGDQPDGLVTEKFRFDPQGANPQMACKDLGPVSELREKLGNRLRWTVYTPEFKPEDHASEIPDTNTARLDSVDSHYMERCLRSVRSARFESLVVRFLPDRHDSTRLTDLVLRNLCAIRNESTSQSPPTHGSHRSRVKKIEPPCTRSAE